MAAQQILLFGDQADAPIPMIRRLQQKSGQSKNLDNFLQSAVDNVQLEVAKLTSAEQDTIGSFQSVQDLTTALVDKTDRHGIAQMVLVFIARVGELILHSESDPTLLSSATPLLSLGICGGLLPAAAASVAVNVSELIEVASFLAGINCRVAAAISRRSVQIEGGTGSWAFSVLGKVVLELPGLLNQFHKDNSVPRHRQAYIAISTPTWATVFGPPSVLNKLIKTCPTLSKSNLSVLPAFGAVHAGHLAAPEFEELVPESPLLDKSIKPGYKLISGSKYAPFVGSTLRDLLPQIMLDIFQNSTNPARLFDTCGSYLRKRENISLIVLGATSYLVLLRRSLHTQKFEVTLKTSAPGLPKTELRGGSGSVAIIGMSGQFPGASSVDEMWDILMRREEHHRKIPTERFNVDDYLDETGRGPSAITSPYGCFLEHPGLFDHKMFSVSPREAMQMDPGQRLLMHAVYEALEDAGVCNNGSVATDSRRIGTYIGDGSDDWRELQQQHGVDKYVLGGTQRSFTPGRLNHHFNWEGATFCVDSACGSTASAVGLAYRALISRDCDTAVAGGSNIIATPFWQSVLSKGGFLSTTGGCKTFRSDADGYCRGEAVGVVVLKRLEDALQDNDNIMTVICSYARNLSAETVSITRPHVATQERVYRSALHKAGLAPDDISYVEMHGTGTTAGDSAELESVVNVLAQKESRDTPLMVGAIKANLGHAGAASGISSIMKAAVMFRKGMVPPQVGIPHKLGDYACLKQGSILIPGEAVPYTRQSVGRKRRMMVNNFDAAGGNSSFVLEEAPMPQIKAPDPRSYHTIAISAHCPSSLKQSQRRLLAFLDSNPQTCIADLAYTTTARRSHHQLRSAYTGSTIENITSGLQRDLSRGHEKADRIGGQSPPVVFVFTGQGAHYAGMGANLFKTSSSFRETILSLQRTSTAHGFPSFSHFISDPGTVMENATTAQIQLALVSLEMALVDLWKSWGVAPDWVIGHSIGEYAALYAARVLSAADVMYLVGRRARLIQNSCTEGTNGMLSISGTPDEIECIVKGQYPDLKSLNYEVACQNSPGMVVLSGERGGLARVESMSKEIGLKCRILDVPYAMHSRQMESILPGLRDIAQGLHFEAPDANVKIISTLSGAEHVVFDSEYIVRHTREPVNFQQAVSHCVKQGLIAESALWLELGPNPVCLGLARANTNSITPDRLLTSLKKGEDDWKCVSKTIATCYAAGKTIGWRAYHRDFAKNLTLLTLPKYAFETRDFWMPYTEAATVVTRVRENGTEKPISTCLHHLIGQQDDVVEQRAIFTCMLSEPSLLRIIQGHRLSGITICPAGVFSEMALTAARYMLGGGSWAAPFPPLSVLDTQIDHPIMPEPNISQAIKVAVSRFDGSNEFSVSISDQAKPDVISSKCLVRIRDEHTFQDERRRLLDVIQPRIVKLQKAAIAGAANRFQGKLFYRLFANLMGYDERYEGVKEAIVSSDFTEALASVQLPVETDDMYTLSPYWIDALTHLAGFLFNGNPMSTTDDVYIGTHMERMEIVAKDFSPDITYQSYASVEHDVPSGTYRGNVYILDGDFVVGFLEGARFRKMPRTTLHRILGKPAPPKQVGEQSSRPITNGTTIKANGTNGVNGTNGTDVNGMNGVNGTNGVNGHTTAASAQSADTVSNGHSKSLYSILIDLLVEETGMEADELTASTYFAEIGVDSLMSISILAMLKTETGIELNASFLMDYPTLEDAGRELRKLENKQNAIQNPSLPISDGNAPTESLPECNLVLMQGNAVASPSHTPLFLLADGAGSAAAYIHLPKLGSDLSVYAVESPWVNDPENFTCSFDRAAGLYLSAIRAKQPRGPYMIGGWSGGGVFAYEVARLLLEAGEVVLGLIIIDITGPRAEDISKITPPSMEVIDKIGMLSGIERNFDDTAPQSVRLKQHMLSTVACFAGVKPIPMVSGRQPGCTSVIWAKKDILPKSAQASLPSGLDAWFYPSSHADIKPYGWDALVGGNLDIFQIEGDHFSIMTVPEVIELGRILRVIIEKCSKMV